MSETAPIDTIESAPAASGPPPAALAGVSKRFGATQALADVSLNLLSGEIHGLVGENGGF